MSLACGKLTRLIGGMPSLISARRLMWPIIGGLSNGGNGMAKVAHQANYMQDYRGVLLGG